MHADTVDEFEKVREEMQQFARVLDARFSLLGMNHDDIKREGKCPNSINLEIAIENMKDEI